MRTQHLVFVRFPKKPGNSLGSANARGCVWWLTGCQVGRRPRESYGFSNPNEGPAGDSAQQTKGTTFCIFFLYCLQDFAGIWFIYCACISCWCFSSDLKSVRLVHLDLLVIRYTRSLLYEPFIKKRSPLCLLLLFFEGLSQTKCWMCLYELGGCRLGMWRSGSEANRWLLIIGCLAPCRGCFFRLRLDVHCGNEFFWLSLPRCFLGCFNPKPPRT